MSNRVSTFSEIEQAGESTSNEWRIRAIVAAMKGSPKDYIFDGEVVDLKSPQGTCVCGHAIQFVFYVRNPKTGHKVGLGSSCICNYNVFSEETVARIEENISHRQKLAAEELKAAKELQRQQEIKNLETEFLSLFNKIHELYNSNNALPYGQKKKCNRNMYLICNRGVHSGLYEYLPNLAYKSKPALIKKYHKCIDTFKAIVANPFEEWEKRSRVVKFGTVARGRKVPIGTAGRIIWEGEQTNHWGTTTVVCLLSDAGVKTYVNKDNIDIEEKEVIA